MSGELGSEGRLRRDRSWAIVGLIVLLVAAIGLVSSARGGEPLTASRGERDPARPTGGVEAPSLTGRLVYAASARDGVAGLRERLVVYDLDEDTVDVGPRIPTSFALVPAAGEVVALAERSEREDAAYRVDPFRPDARAEAIAAAAVVAPSSTGDSLLVAERRSSAACDGDAFVARLLPLEASTGSPVRRAAGCGRVISAAVAGSAIGLTVVVERRPSVYVAVTPRAPLLRVARRVAVLGRGPMGPWLFVRQPERVDPALPPTGPLLVWPGQGAPRTAVDGFRATRVLAWAPGGTRAVVNGTLADERAMWLVYPAAGTAVPILPSSRFDLGTAFSGAAFDRYGNVFGASEGVIVAATSSGVFPIELPPGAPTPAGPIAWLAGT